jgi:hypothetical protein
LTPPGSSPIARELEHCEHGGKLGATDPAMDAQHVAHWR